MADFPTAITANDIVFALAVSLAATYMISRIKVKYRLIKSYGSIRIVYSSNNPKAVIKSCSDIFPRENFSFRGSLFKKGSTISVKTNENGTIIGCLIGVNDDNMICLITKRHIIAHELTHIISVAHVNTLDSFENDEF